MMSPKKNLFDAAESNLELWFLAKRILLRYSLRHHLRISLNPTNDTMKASSTIFDNPEGAWVLLGHLVDSAKSERVKCDIGAGYLEDVLENANELTTSRLLIFVTKHPRFWGCAQYSWFSPANQETVNQVALLVGAPASRGMAGDGE